MTHLVVHCSATPAAQDVGVKEIELQHRQRGLFRIGFHYVIRRDGTVETGRPLDMPGAHVPRYNQCSIGICLVGGADDKNDFTPQQMSALLVLVRTLRVKFPRADIVGHRDMPRVVTTSPSFDVPSWLSAAEGSAQVSV